MHWLGLGRRWLNLSALNYCVSWPLEGVVRTKLVKHLRWLVIYRLVLDIALSELANQLFLDVFHFFLGLFDLGLVILTLFPKLLELKLLCLQSLAQLLFNLGISVSPLTLHLF